ncbi:MAG TPA: wax ester/triacylglycerol synthase family O-acyltransferase [Acidimicrobiales bacterium]|nr:wax ester/triacylglycerol synthase family O-acyltransferase [Acidimicrobiales bacterium]
MRRLSGLDAGFLYLETPSMHMHVGLACVLDPSDLPGGWSFANIRELVENRLPLLPPFRRRVVEVPFGLHHPVWIEDPNFDLDYHLRRASLPSPGGVSELADFFAEFLGRPLDQSRPLWEMYVVEGLEGGRVAVVTKTHHAAIDGVSGAELAANLLDLSPEPAVVPPPDPPWRPDRMPTELELLSYAVGSLAKQPFGLFRAVEHAVEAGLHLARRNRPSQVALPPAPFSAPKTRLNTSITPHRRVALTQVPLDEVKEVKRNFEVTVNDVILAICAGSLRRYLLDHEELPEGPLVGMVPVSVRSEDQRQEGGNRVSAMLVSLATATDDPVERLRLISEGTEGAKDQHSAIGAETLMDWVEFAAPAVAARAARLVSRTKVFDRVRPLFNVVISNVPGPSFPLYCAGARLEAMYPMGPVVDGVGLNMTVMSYHGSIYVGLLACREVVPELDQIADGIQESLAELTKAAKPR